MKFKKLVSLFLAVLVVGCKGNFNQTIESSELSSADSDSYTLTAIDGYLSGAEVYIDWNKDGIADSDELTGTTDSNGQIELENEAIDYPVIVRAIADSTVDSDSGNTVSDTYEMIADAGASVATPYTTLSYLYDVDFDELVTVLDPNGTIGLDSTTISGDYAALEIDVAQVLARSLALILKETIAKNYDTDTVGITALDTYVEVIVDTLEEESYSSDSLIVFEKDSDDNVVAVVVTTVGSSMNTDTSSSIYAINDTGITTCVDGSGVSIDCFDTTSDTFGQDGNYGRDSLEIMNSNDNGDAGFNFTKVSSLGVELDASETDWDCVQDNITGLMWEVKTDDDGQRDKDWTYTWYSVDSETNGGDEGTEDDGSDATSSSCYEGVNNSGSNLCNTSEYVALVNTSKLCGYDDWRMPTVNEMSSLVHYGKGKPAMDTDYFPNTHFSTYSYWSASTVSNTNTKAWVADFTYGRDWSNFKTSVEYVRLVRSNE